MRFIFFSARRELERLAELDRAQAAGGALGEAAAKDDDAGSQDLGSDDEQDDNVDHDGNELAADAASTSKVQASTVSKAAALDAELGAALQQAFAASSDASDSDSDSDQDDVPEAATQSQSSTLVSSQAAAHTLSVATHRSHASASAVEEPKDAATYDDAAAANRQSKAEPDPADGLDPTHPLSALCSVLNRDQLMEFFQVREM